MGGTYIHNIIVQMRLLWCVWFVSADMDDSGFLEGEVGGAGDVSVGDGGGEEQSQDRVVASPELLD